jgi:riboflavin synthase
MFTGIVEALGTVAEITDQGDAARLAVRAGPITADAHRGDSIAVNGVCLTVVSVHDGVFTADVMKETLARSCLGELSAGDSVNLERAAVLGARMGGHLVQGHVDGVGRIAARQPRAHEEMVTITLPLALEGYVVEKGSISVDGVSLTVITVGGGTFSVGLIPTTLELTTLGRKAVGALVNLEVDVIAKYVEKLLTAGGPR